MGELDDGSPFVAIGKLQKQIEQILESHKKMVERIKSLEAKIKIAESKAQHAMIESVAVKHKRARGAAKLKGSVKSYPAYPLWVEFVRDNYRPISSEHKEIYQTWKSGNLIKSSDIRQDLAIKFGQQMLDDKYLSKFDISKIIQAAGFKTGINREFQGKNGLENHQAIVLCVKK